jgi:hypothetical protein
VDAPIAGLSKPDLAALIKQFNSADAATLLNIAAPDLPKLAPILAPPETSAGADHVQHHLMIAAKLDADVKLDQAEQAIGLAGGKKLADWETSPLTLLQIGRHLSQTGGYTNYLRAAALAETIQSAYWGASLIFEQTVPPATPSARLGFEKKTAFVLTWPFAVASFKKLQKPVRLLGQQLWRRAPLLVLLLSWLVVGVVGGIFFSGFGFEFWAIGFLALVGFGFYSTVRK